MGVDEMGVDEVGVDEMGSRRSGTTPSKTIGEILYLLTNFMGLKGDKKLERKKETDRFAKGIITSLKKTWWLCP